MSTKQIGLNSYDHESEKFVKRVNADDNVLSSKNYGLASALNDVAPATLKNVIFDFRSNPKVSPNHAYLGATYNMDLTNGAVALGISPDLFLKEEGFYNILVAYDEIPVGQNADPITATIALLVTDPVLPGVVRRYTSRAVMTALNADPIERPHIDVTIRCAALTKLNCTIFHTTVTVGAISRLLTVHVTKLANYKGKLVNPV